MSSLGDIWRNRWNTSGVNNAELVNDSHYRVPGFDLPRSLWTTLNWIRTKKSRCQYLLHKWNLNETQNCECGRVQIIRHIVEGCSKKCFKEGLGKLHDVESRGVNRLKEFEINVLLFIPYLENVLYFVFADLIKPYASNGINIHINYKQR